MGKYRESSQHMKSECITVTIKLNSIIWLDFRRTDTGYGIYRWGVYCFFHIRFKTLGLEHTNKHKHTLPLIKRVCFRKTTSSVVVRILRSRLCADCIHDSGAVILPPWGRNLDRCCARTSTLCRCAFTSVLPVVPRCSKRLGIYKTVSYSCKLYVV